MRIGVASVAQETNTFSLGHTTLRDFTAQGLYRGREALVRLERTNTEIAGAAEELVRRAATPVGLLRAFAVAGPRVAAETFDGLAAALELELERAGRLDGLVLSLHGAMAAEGADAADATLAARARAALGAGVPIGVCLDLHANVTGELLDSADAVIGYRTYPHVDQAETGARIAALVTRMAAGELRPTTALAKRRMIVPAETTATTAGPVAELRQAADSVERERALDASIFTVQPWLDVESLGVGVTVTTDGDAAAAKCEAERLADLAWAARDRLAVPLLAPADAIAEARRRDSRPTLLVESSDSPTAGASGDSAAMVGALLEHGDGLVAYTTLRDVPAVAACWSAGRGATLRLELGATIDARFAAPVALVGEVTCLRSEPVVLEGPVWTGMAMSMGRMAVVRCGTLSVVLSEIGPYTFDPAAFRAVGLDPTAADVVVVRSATMFRAGFAGVAAGEPLFLDLPGASTPRLAHLHFERAPRPLYPVDP